MRVLHLIPTYYPAVRMGGPIWSVHNMNKWLVREGVRVTVYTTDLEGRKNMDVPLGQAVDVDGVEVVYFPSHFFKSWEYSSEMHKAIGRNASRFDILHTTSVFRSVSALGAHYAKTAGVPYVISPRGNLMREPMRLRGRLKKFLYLRLIERKNLEHASAIHFTTDGEKKEFEELNIFVRYSFVMPNGLDPGEYKDMPEPGYFRGRFGIPENKKIILFLGRISWKKGFDTLIPAFKKVSCGEANTVLVVAGSDEENYRKKIDVLIKKENLGGKVIFTGVILGKEKISAFRESSLFVLPSYAENFGMAVAEALFLETPVVVSDGVAISDAIKAQRAGLVVKKDPHRFADAMLSVIRDKNLCLELSKNGRQLAEKEYFLPKLTKKLINEYEAAIRRKE